jgi:hypothetical protein
MVPSGLVRYCWCCCWSRTVLMDLSLAVLDTTFLLSRASTLRHFVRATLPICCSLLTDAGCTIVGDARALD